MAAIDFATSLVLMAAHNVADKYENVNNSLATSAFSTLAVHKPVVSL